MTEITIALQPKQKLFANSLDQFPVTFFGGAKGGGKSGGLRRIYLLRRFQYPGSHGAIFRQTFPELEANHIRPLFIEFPMLRQYWNDSKKLLSLPNGSTLEFCYCEGEKDLPRYQGREFHDLGIDEAGQWQENTFRTLWGSNRSSVKGLKTSCALTGNPGGIGHGWLKRIFIERRFNERERPQDYNFIQAFVKDNEALMANDPDYVHKLMTEPNEALRRAFLDGDWNVFAGQYFQELSKEVHLIKPFDIPPHWNRFGAYDYGFNHPASFGWYATDEDGNVYKYRELVKAQMRVDQFARAINEFKDTSLLYPIVAGHDCWAKRTHTINSQQGQNPPTIAEEFQSHGINLKQAVIDRIQGASHLRNYLAWKLRGLDDNGKPVDRKPRLQIFDTCPITFDTLSRMIHDPDRVEDVLKVDATDGDPLSGDDAYDETRYALMSRPAISDKEAVVTPIGSKAWYEKQAENIWDRERENIIKQSGDSGNWPEEGNFGQF